MKRSIVLAATLAILLAATPARASQTVEFEWPDYEVFAHTQEIGTSLWTFWHNGTPDVAYFSRTIWCHPRADEWHCKLTLRVEPPDKHVTWLVYHVRFNADTWWIVSAAARAKRPSWCPGWFCKVSDIDGIKR